MADEERTLRQLTAPNWVQQEFAVQFPVLDEGVNFELKAGLIHLLPQFHGLNGDDPNKHLAEFHSVCMSMKPAGVTEEQIKMRAFPFSLKDEAKDWFYYLPRGSIDTWEKMKKAFLEKYFPATRLSSLRKKISNIEQQAGETLYEYYDHFRRLIASCPYHGYSDQDLILYLYGGLLDDDRRLVNAACGGSILDKTPAAAFELFGAMSESSRQFSRRVTQSAVKLVRACRFCDDTRHSSDDCPRYEDPGVSVNAVRGVDSQRLRHESYFNTHNSGWRDNINHRYGHENTSGIQLPAPKADVLDTLIQSITAMAQNMSTMGTTMAQSVSALGERVETVVQQQQEAMFSLQSHLNQQFTQLSQTLIEAKSGRSQETVCAMTLRSGTQLGQLSQAVCRMEARESGKLPSQMVVNPRENVNAMMLRSGAEIEGRKAVEKEVQRPREKANVEKELEGENNDEAKEPRPRHEGRDRGLFAELKEENAESKPRPRPENRDRGFFAEKISELMKRPRPRPQNRDRGSAPVYVDDYVRPDFPPLFAEKPPAPFPEALVDTGKPVKDKDMFDWVSNCEVNVPLLKLLTSIPRYAKFLKEVCTQKRKRSVKEKKKVVVSENVSAMLQKRIPKKADDPGMFTIPCKIGGTLFDKALLDLGASINVLPLAHYESLDVGPLEKTGIVIQLADNSIVNPKGILQDVLVKVDHLLFPADFFVIDTGQDKDSPVMLGRPFMNTAGTKIDVSSGSLTMEFDGVKVGFSIYDQKRHPPDGDPKRSLEVSEPS